MVEYRDYYIAFLDILGFSNMVLSKTAHEIHEIFKYIKMSKRLSKRDGSTGDLEKDTYVAFFSDTIICAIPCEYSGAFELLISHCLLIQHVLWKNTNPVWVRGAIAKGKLYCKGAEMFGPGLVEAYNLEATLAIYPRIIMTQDTYKQGIVDSNSNEEIAYVSDTSDDLKMIDTLRYFSFNEIVYIRSQIEKALRSETNKAIREKYLWIKDYYNECVRENNMNEYFREKIK